MSISRILPILYRNINMARASQSKKQLQNEASPNPTKALLVHLPAQLHVRLKIASAQEGRPMSKLVIQMLSKGLKEIGGKAARNIESR